MQTSIWKKWLCAAVGAAFLTAGAYADVLLEIDLSVPNEITINATSGLSAVTTSGDDFFGAYFENFYNGPGTGMIDSGGVGDLTNTENPADFSPGLFRAADDPGLNIWSWSSDTTVTFTAGSQAFTGSATWALDPAVYADMLAGNTSGDVYFPADTVDDIAAGAVLLGQYRVVPEPATLSLMLLGLGLGLRRSRS